MLGQIIGGLIVGVIARLIMPGKENLPGGLTGFLITIILGIAGAWLGGFIATNLWAGDNYVVGWTMSIIGAILLLIIYRLIFGRSSN